MGYMGQDKAIWNKLGYFFGFQIHLAGIRSDHPRHKLCQLGLPVPVHTCDPKDLPFPNGKADVV